MFYVVKNDNGDFLKNGNGSVRYFSSKSGATQAIQWYTRKWVLEDGAWKFVNIEHTYRVYAYLGETIDKGQTKTLPETVNKKRGPSIYFARDKYGKIYQSEASGKYAFSRLCDLSNSLYYGTTGPYIKYSMPLAELKGEAVGV